MINFDETRIIPWALACSLNGASHTLAKINHSYFTFSPQLTDGNHISLFKESGIIFSDQNLIRAVEYGFAMPRIIPLLVSPKISISSIKTLKAIQGFYKQADPTLNQVMVLLRCGLETCAVFSNLYASAKNILADESGFILFSIEGLGQIGWFGKNKEGNWQAGTDDAPANPSALIIFKNINFALKSAIGQIDHLIDPTIGNVKTRGRIPLLDKFGFVSRIAFKLTPTPINDRSD